MVLQVLGFPSLSTGPIILILLDKFLLHKIHEEELLWLKLEWEPGVPSTQPLSEQLLGELFGLQGTHFENPLFWAPPLM